MSSDQRWSSRKMYTMALFCQTFGAINTHGMISAALKGGVLVNIFTTTIVYIFIGIPLLYMEMIIGQFTSRDCIKVWYIRPCLSHVGYILILLQIITMIKNHITLTFTTHYLLTCFENPIPFYECGRWADSTCNLLERNYSANHDCLKNIDKNDYCVKMPTTLPEYQYFRYYMLQCKSNELINWRLVTPSILIIIIMFLCLFRRKLSLQWFIPFMSLYPVFGYVALLMGSMMQQGVVERYEQAIDINFERFVKYSRVSMIIGEMIQALAAGTGIIFNLSSSTSFRSPCHYYAVITVVFSIVCNILCFTTIAMMSCPMAYKLQLPAAYYSLKSLSLMFEKVPRFLFMYEQPFFWLIVFYSSNMILGLRTNVMIFYGIQEIVMTRYKRIAYYPSLFCFGGLLVLFLLTLPLLGTMALPLFATVHRRVIMFSLLWLCAAESIVFLMWYGMKRIAADVNFMLGIQTRSCYKFLWFSLTIILLVVLSKEIYFQLHRPNKHSKYYLWLGMITLGIVIFGTMIVTLGRLAVAKIRGNFNVMLNLDPAWGPKDELLHRSRAMFSVQAMTKEYIYRQHHLLGGIIKRQKRANIRVDRSNE